MTKEPIMIDGVDVAECKYAEPSYTTPKCAINDWIHCDGHDCHFKQLKRKEQECEELLKFNNSLVKEHKTIGNDLYKEIKDYRIKLKTKEEECEKKDKDIKFLLEKLDLANNRIQDCEIYWEKEKKNLKQQLDQLEKENVKLKELVKTRMEDLCDSCGASSMMPMPCKVYEQALQEILDEARDGYSGGTQTSCENSLKQIIEKIEVLNV